MRRVVEVNSSPLYCKIIFPPSLSSPSSTTSPLSHHLPSPSPPHLDLPPLPHHITSPLPHHLPSPSPPHLSHLSLTTSPLLSLPTPTSPSPLPHHLTSPLPHHITSPLPHHLSSPSPSLSPPLLSHSHRNSKGLRSTAQSGSRRDSGARSRFAAVLSLPVPLPSTRLSPSDPPSQPSTCTPYQCQLRGRG